MPKFQNLEEYKRGEEPPGWYFEGVWPRILK